MTYRYEILKDKPDERKLEIDSELSAIEQAIEKLKKCITLLEIEQVTLEQEKMEIRELLEEWNGKFN